VDGKPLLVIYRPSLFPNIIETTQRWRNWCRESGLGEIHLAYTQSFESKDPISYGFDSAIEFPPNNACPPNLTNEVKKSNAGFQGTAYDWRHYSKKSESYSEHGYSLFRSVCPAWDNTARRKDRGTLFLNSAPSGYQTWLENAIVHTRQTRIKSQSERIVFINAWNEWAEGAHLEPDQKYGYAYLEATHNALVNTATTSNSKAIVLITHDCHKHGAQFQTLETARVFKSMGYQVFTLSLGGGDLFSDFAAISQIINIRNCDANQVDSFLNQAKRAGATVAISSTVVAGSILPKLKEFQFKIISLIHELPGIIKSLKQENNAKNVVEYADKIVFPAKLVSDKFSEIAPTPDSKVIIRPQGLLRRNIFKGQRQFAREQVLDKYKLSPDSKIILTVGYGDDRKGVDQLARLAKATLQHQPKSVFIWVGSIEARLLSALKKEIEDSDLSNQIILADFQPDPSIFYAAADAYALTSLEDPFPNVVNEAIDMDVPVVAYQGATGAADYITANRGKLSRWMDIDDFAINLSAVLQQKREPLPCKGGSLRQYILDLMFYIDNQHRLSVVVPNYNYAKYLPERIRSIAVQDYPIYELIILDDHSSDNSLEVIHELANNLDFDTLVVANETNSGSVFKQWSTGAALARGDLLWIAEADEKF
jgi:glycosyltransferase involved in cell wall biosynthesis